MIDEETKDGRMEDGIEADICRRTNERKTTLALVLIIITQGTLYIVLCMCPPILWSQNEI